MDFILYTTVFLLGATVGYIELIGYCPEGPLRVFRIWASYVYLIFNGLASVLVYWIIVTSGINFSKENAAINNFLQISIAGFSALAFLRSSFARVKIGSKEVDVGFVAVLQAILDQVMKAFERKRSNVNVLDLSKIMKGIDFDKAKLDLPALCIELQGTLTEQQTKELGKKIDEIENKPFMNNTKCIQMGYAVAKTAGFEFLENAVEILRVKISLDPSLDKDKTTMQMKQEELKLIYKQLGEQP